MKRKITILCLFLSIFTFGLFAQAPLVYDQENTGAHYPQPHIPDYEELPIVQLLPDPFKFFHDGSRDTTFTSWERRRNEIKASIEKYEIGPKPTNSDLTIAAGYAGGVLTVNIVRSSTGASLTLESRINLPSGTPPEGGWPALIGMSLAPSGGPVSDNIAKIDFMHDQVTTYALGQDVSHVSDPYFIMYPEYYTGDSASPLGVEQVGQYSAWAWGVSRLIDGMEIAAQQLVNPLPINTRRLGVNGCSYAGKMALFSGAFDERIAATFAQESGGGGAPAWRVSHKIEPAGSVEKVDNTNGIWFKQGMKSDFGGDNVYKFPHDHHELMAMVAPRALFVSGNTDFTWLSNRAVYVTSKATQEIYETLGVGDRFGYWIDGNHGHCAVGAGQQPVIDAFYNKFLVGQDIDWDIHVSPSSTDFTGLDPEPWYGWWGTGNSDFPPEPDGKKVWLEAECGTVGSDWDVVADPEASNGTYVTVRSGIQSTDNAPTNPEANIVLPFEIDSAASYNFIARINAPSADDDSFWVKIDDGAYVMANGLTTSGWAWVTLANATLEVGTHSLTIAYREDGALLDKLLVTTNSSGPGDLGANATNCPLPNEAPTVTANQGFQIDDTMTNGDFVGTLTGSDFESDLLQNWTITGGSGAAVFELDAATGDLSILDKSQIDFENSPIELLVTVSDGNKTSAPETVTIHLEQTMVPLVYSVENRGAGCASPVLPTLEDLPVILPLPDPFMRSDNQSRSTDYSDWSCRRNEIKAEIENYEIGPKPDRPDTINAAFVPDANGGVLTVNIIRNGRTLTLTSRITIPQGEGPFPAVIGMSLAGGGTGSIPSDIFTSRNIATVEFLHNQVTTYAAGQAAPKVNDPYYQMYPENIDAGQYSAWSWGVSRLIDGLEIATQQSINPLPVDLSHMAVTGCSYAGKMSLFAGAMDERIALTIAQESGGGGAPSWRFSHTEPDGTVEKIDNTDYSWFSEDMRQFSGDNVYKLPHDHHELMAMVAPRALLVTGNTDFTWLSNRSCYVSAKATKEVYKTFGIGDRMGFYIDGGHGHCAVPESQRPAVEAFVDKFLLGDTTANTDIGVHPYPEVDAESWYDWWGTGSNNEKPIVAAEQSFVINDRAQNNDIVGTLAGADADGDTLQNWTIVGGSGAAAFAVDAATGVLTIADQSQIDYSGFSHDLQVTVSDGTDTSDPATVIIELQHSPVITPGQIFSTDDQATANDYVGTVVATDQDAGTVFTNWQVLGGTGASSFSIDASTGDISVSAPSVAAGDYTLQLRVDDQDGNYSDTETVSLHVIQTNPNPPVITAGQVFKIDYVTYMGEVVGVIEATDAEGDDLRDWTVVGGYGSLYFDVYAETGEIYVIDTNYVNYNRGQYDLQVTVSDGVNTSAVEGVIMHLNDRVQICHKGEEKWVPEQAVPGHLGHGDNLGECQSGQRQSEGAFATDKKAQLRVYPNPATTGLSVDLGTNPNTVSRIDLMDLSGKVVRSAEVGADLQFHWTVSEFKPGIYFLRLKGRTVVTHKILIK
ncbi:T9SS type A sorting domain-containing protein [Marinoscillum sp.]|uniref:T9SS type A sorting domain-containing protein n=1 Tax=Marinoscillum sp. TaxID=2024838 RepID=UPI003BABDD67